MEMMNEVMVLATVLAPTTTALVQSAKKIFPLKKNYVPALGLVIGAGIGAAAYPFTDLAWDVRLWAGGFAGLASVGLFELVNKRTGVTK